MTLSPSNPESSSEGAQLLIDKNDLIKVLKNLIEDYPSDAIPQDVVEKALAKVIGYHNAGSLEDNPALKKLEQTLAKARSIYPS